MAAEAAEANSAMDGKQGKEKALGHFEKISEIKEKYKQEIAEVRQQIQPPELKDSLDDIDIYRFLRGHKFKMPKVIEMVNNAVAFRQKHKCDEIRAKAANMSQDQLPYHDKISRCFPHSILHKTDKQGQPLSIDLLGLTDPTTLCRLMTYDQFLDYQLYHVEMKSALLRKLSYETGHVMRSCKIVDLTGLNLRQLHRQGLSWMRQILKMTQDANPEMLGNLYVVNVPWLFKTFWQIVSTWLEPATLEKIQVLGSDWKEQLKTKFDADALPEFLGGTCADHKGDCVAVVHPDHDLVQLTVASRASHEVKSSPLGKEDVVEWEFRTDSHDISFSAVFTPEDSAQKQQVVVPAARVDSHRVNVTGSFQAPSAGVVTFTFDNSYSRWTSKKVFYRTDITSKQMFSAEVADADAEATAASTAASTAAAQPAS